MLEPTLSARRRRAIVQVALIPLLAFLLLVATASLAVERPRIYAITGATVVPAPGQQIESGTVLIRDGLIESVGADVAVPADAVEIDARDRWIYPGLIDADSQLGIRPAAASVDRPRTGSPPGGLRGSTTTAGAVHPISRVHAERRVRDRLVSFSGENEKEVERIRNLGFTAVLATPDSGILRGISTAILLSDDRPVARMILRDDVAQHAALERGRFGRGYPSSLMGAVATIRQALLDGQRYLEWTERYSADPLGMRRPDVHASYVALAPLLSGEHPLIFRTDNPQDTLLADRIGGEFGLNVAISTSSHEAEYAERIAGGGRTLIVSVGFPDKPKVKEDSETLEVSRDEMRRYLDAASGPARLHAAGVPFALTLQGLKNAADFPGQMQKIVEGGLPENAALAALTRVPAEIMGIQRMVGSLEPGKIANLLVADGPLFAEKTRIRSVFVDGVEYEVKVKEKPKGDPDAVVDPRGEWSVVFDMRGRTIQRAWTIGGSAGAYTGTAETRAGTSTFDSVELAGNVLTVVLPASGDRPASEATVIIEGDDFEGSMEMGSRTATLSGRRTSGPDGDWR